MPRWDTDNAWGGTPRRQKPRPTASARARVEPIAKPPSKAATSAASDVDDDLELEPAAEPAPKQPSKSAPTTAAAAEAEEALPSEADAESLSEPHERAVAVKGIEGTMSEYDVKATLEARARDFDHCHDARGRAGSGHISFRIRILPNGDVSDVRVRQSSVRDRTLIGCYSDVIKSSTFPTPHGGYADVNWSTKVGRSKPRPGDIFERRGRWDAPSAGGGSRRSSRHGRRGS